MVLGREGEKQTPQGSDQSAHDGQEPRRLPATDGDDNGRQEQGEGRTSTAQPHCGNKKEGIS